MPTSLPEHLQPTCPVCGRNKIKAKGSKQCAQCRFHPGWFLPKVEPTAIQPPNESQSAAIQPVPYYETAWAEWRRWIGAAHERYTAPADRPPGARQKILIASDLHCPFQDKQYVAEMFADTTDCDVAIFAGDLMDSYGLSRFLKYEQVPIETEVAEVTTFLEQASQQYPRVILLEGNHGNARLEKQLLALDRQLVNAIRILTGGNLSLLRAAASRFENVELGVTQVGRHRMDWLVQVGDLIVTHAEKFSIVPGSAMRKVEEWLADQERTLDLQPWRVVAQAHTHQLGMFPWHADKLLLETGCLCETHGYQLTARIGGRPQRRGWWTLEQQDGWTDYDSIRMRWPDARREAA
jgi:Icc-related predicted phosphoesterase